MDLALRPNPPQRAMCVACGSVGTDRDAVVATLLATSRDYFALPADAARAARATAAPARAR